MCDIQVSGCQYGAVGAVQAHTSPLAVMPSWTIAFLGDIRAVVPCHELVVAKPFEDGNVEKDEREERPDQTARPGSGGNGVSRAPSSHARAGRLSGASGGGRHQSLGS
jgi:hypothetical protein